MPPSAKRPQRPRRDTRKGTTASSPPADIGDSSPSRPAKRRRRATSSARKLLQEPDSAARQTSTSRTSDVAESPPSDDESLVTHVIQHLKTQPVQASKDHANAIHEAIGDRVQAFAKVSALDWTFYITKLSVNIGRAPETTQPVPFEDPDLVHIDLGPSKTVSREHAAICFDTDEEKWFLNVKGRNGAKINDRPIPAGQSHPLTSGEVIEIGNVEMIFVLPSAISTLHIHPTFLERCGWKPETPRPGSPRHHAQALPKFTYRRPGTPPLVQSHGVPGSGFKSPSVSTPAAVMVGAHSVDLSRDENQHIKPQFSYAQMITQAIINAPDGKLNLNGIYNFIMDSYSYYRHQQPSGWQNSIRHNLSLNKAFDKVARSTDEPGKGMKWQIVADAKDEMIRNAFRVGRGGHRGSSAPSSPSQLNYVTQGPKDMLNKESPSRRKQALSPLASPTPRGSFHLVQSTPDRRTPHLGGRAPTLTADGSPLPRSRKALHNTGTATPTAPPTSSVATDPSLPGFQPQSPTLTSSYLQDDGASFVTPAPPRVHPKLAPPSTAQRPSQHMPTSSPAPFWKYADIGSTPLKPSAPYESSPTKSPGAHRGASTLPAQSSSPAPAGKSPPSSPSRPQNRILHQEPSEDHDSADVEEEHGFDLTKGFQSIGSYHAPVGRGLSIANGLNGRP